MVSPIAGISGLNNSSLTAGTTALGRIQSNTASLTGLQNSSQQINSLTGFLQNGNIVGQSLMGMGGSYSELGGLLSNSFQILGNEVAGAISLANSYAIRKQQENIALQPLAAQEQQAAALKSLLSGKGTAGASGANPLATIMSLLSGQGGTGGAAGAGGAQQNPMQAIVALFAMLLQGLQGQRQA